MPFHSKPLLILDLDETLIYSCPKILKDQDIIYKFNDHGIIYYTFKRPHVNEFLGYSSN